MEKSIKHKRGKIQNPLLFLRNIFMLHYRGSIQARLTCLFVLSALIPITLLSGLITYSNHKVITEKELQYVNDKLESVNSSLNTVFTEMEKNMASLLVHSDIDRILNSPAQPATLEWFYQTKSIEQTLRNASPHLIEQVAYTLLTDSGEVYSSRSGINWQEKLDSTLAQTIIDNAWRTSLFQRKLEDYSSTPVITMGKTIKDQSRVVGIMIADLDKAWLDEMFRVFDDGVSVYITRSGEAPFYWLDGSLPPDRILQQGYIQGRSSGDILRIDSKRYLYIRGGSEDDVLQAFALLPMDVVFRDSHNNILRLVIILLVVAVQTAIFARLVSARFSRDIRALSSKVEVFGDCNGTQVIEMEPQSQDEIGSLVAGVGDMSRRIVAMMKQIRADEEKKRELEIAALQSQMNPHMLYNTLNTITYLAKLQGILNIQEVSAGFALMMRILSKTSGLFLTIRQELDYIRSYIDVKKYQISANLDVVYEVEESLLDKHILKLILQPFVENAINHAFDEQSSSASIVIAIWEECGHIFIQIDDNGKGMSKDAVSGVMAAGKKTGVGIGNTIDRLRLQYYDDYTFEITSEPEQGTTILMSFPDCEV